MKAGDWDKLVKDYYKEIESPFSPGVKNPIYAEVKKIKNKKNKSVIDLGCGLGVLEPFLAKDFKNVVAIDFSPKMAKATKECIKQKEIKNVECYVKDMRDLKGFYNKFDAAFSINSILVPSIKDVNKIFGEIYKIIKKMGVFIGILPAIESDIYRAMLTYERELGKFKDAKKAHRKTYTLIGSDTYDFLLGKFYNITEQKHFYRFEIKFRLERAGFKDVKFKRVYYPWEMCSDPDIEFFKKFPKRWDWFVTARK